MLYDDDLIEITNCINNWDGYFEEYRYYSMDELDDVLYGLSPSQVANMIYYGDFNPNDYYFRYDGYENLESTDNPSHPDEEEIIDYFNSNDNVADVLEGNLLEEVLELLDADEPDKTYNDDSVELDEEEEEF